MGMTMRLVLKNGLGEDREVLVTSGNVRLLAGLCGWEGRHKSEAWEYLEGITSLHVHVSSLR